MKIFNLIIAFSILTFSACKPEEPVVDPPKNTGVSLTMKFSPKFKGTPVSWAMAYVNNSADTMSFDKVKYIMSNFVLEKENGELFYIPDGYAYLSLKDGRDSVVFKNLPTGTYKSIRFTLGLDSAVNHSDPASRALDHPLSPSLNEMHWGWAGGYIFNIVEGYYKNNGANAAFSYHVALEKNSRTHSFVETYKMDKNSRMVFDINLDKYFDNVITFGIKKDGAYSHSADVDPVMDKFIQNMNGVFEFVSFK